MYPAGSVFIFQLVFLCQWISTIPLFPVEVCPGNVTEVETASERLNCSFGFDETKNEYHCVPLSNFTQLVEFCYPKTSGLIGKGLCMVLYGSTLDARKCHRFQDGCPNKHYTSEEMYQFPACSQINKESKCYLADPSCPSVRHASSTTSPNKTGRDVNTTTDRNTSNTTTDGNTSNTTTDGNTPMDTGIIVIICIALIFLLVLSAFAYIMCKRKRRQNKYDHNKTRDEEKMPLFEVKETESNGKDIPLQDSTSLVMEDENIKVEDYAKDDEFQKRFQQYLEEGSVDVCPISQIIIVGENRVGKTTLLYRLQGRSQEEIDQIKSIKGMDCHTQKSGFIVSNGKLKMNEEGKSNLAVPPERVLGGITKEKIKKEDTKEENVTEEDTKGDTSMDKETTEVKIPEEDKRGTKEIGDDGDTSLYKSEKSHPTSTEDQVLPEERKSTREEPNTFQAKTDGDLKEIHPSASEMNKRADCNEKPTTEENAKTNAQAKNTEENLTTSPLSAVKRRLAEEQNITMKLRSRNDVVLNSLDFAGQGAYYASHQTYMRKGAIYLIVFDASRSLSKRKTYRISADGMADQDPITSGENICLCDRPYTSFSCWSQSGKFHVALTYSRTHLHIYENI